jgi:hypothetical protein
MILANGVIPHRTGPKGARQQMHCQTCGHHLQPDERFCPDCGTPIPAATQEIPTPPPTQAWPTTLPAPIVAVPPAPAGAPEQWPHAATPDAWTPAPAFGQLPPAPYGVPPTPPARQPPGDPWVAQHPGVGTPPPLADEVRGWSGGFQSGSGAYNFRGDGRPVMPGYRARPQPSTTPSVVAAVVAALVIVALVGGVLAGLGGIGPLASLFATHTTTTSQSSTGSGTTQGTTSTAPTVGPTSVPTVAAAPCTSVLPGAGAASAGGQFGDVPFPAHAAATTVITDSNATGYYTIAHVDACAPNSSPARLQSFYSHSMPAQGWGTPNLDKVPYQDDYFVRCTTHNSQNVCWGKDTAPRYVVLTNVQDAGNNLVTYTLQLFTPPPAPACSGAFAGLSVMEFWTVNDPQWYVPLPPLADAYKVTLGDGSTQVFVCSAGTVASIQNILATNMPKQNWTGSGATWTGGGYTLTFNISDPTDWSFTY